MNSAQLHNSCRPSFPLRPRREHPRPPAASPNAGPRNQSFAELISRLRIHPRFCLDFKGLAVVVHWRDGDAPDYFPDDLRRWIGIKLQLLCFQQVRLQVADECSKARTGVCHYIRCRVIWLQRQLNGQLPLPRQPVARSTGVL